VTNAQEDTVSIIDSQSHQVVDVAEVGYAPYCICTDGSRVFVGHQSERCIFILDLAGNKEAEVPIRDISSDICAFGGKAFVAVSGGTVSILSESSSGLHLLTFPGFLPELSSYPNPFNPECYIPINPKGKGEEVRCKIYNILGPLVKEIECSRVQAFKSSGVYWDGRDSRGLEVPTGVYFYEVGGESIRRMVVLK
jgi:hypothetical protein